MTPVIEFLHLMRVRQKNKSMNVRAAAEDVAKCYPSLLDAAADHLGCWPSEDPEIRAIQEQYGVR